MASWRGGRHGSGLAYCRLPADARLDHRPGENRRFRLADGTFAYDGDTGDFDLTGGAVVVDPFGSVRAAIEARGADGWHLVDLTTPLDREVARFTAEYPLLAAMLGVAAGPSGACSCSTRASRAASK